MKHIAISVLGKDRPGIVSEISRVLFEFGCNIEDSSMTQLRNEFAMILLVAMPAKSPLAELGVKLKAAAKPLGLSVLLRPITEKEDLQHKPSKKQFAISVYGADKPGIVYKITRILSDNKVNITDVQTNIAGRGAGKTYIMLLEASLPAALKADKLKSVLNREAKRLKVAVNLNLVDTPA